MPQKLKEKEEDFEHSARLVWPAIRLSPDCSPLEKEYEARTESGVVTPRGDVECGAASSDE